MRQSSKLVDGKTLLADLFDQKSRPSLRWLRRMRKKGTIPFYVIGGLIRYDPDEVRSALGIKAIRRRP
ncbi:hypothetical protein QEH56_16115 [Pelagicoccus enzymogenes]|uniref:hypothetical protein n=1 Tax=Pelagicoccus enzymogenes TaxID=2773457 RepID=UPI00280FC5C8|nr:hypothetical protein [Pelagicoccus enzymogenes]MDQ8199688.1 hypothetical protein [Pelagicoccus enzymogenes]